MKFCIRCGRPRPRNWRKDKRKWTGVQPHISRTRFSYWACCLDPAELTRRAIELAKRGLELPSRFVRCDCCGNWATENDGKLKPKVPICWPCICEGGAQGRTCAEHPHAKGGTRAR